MKNCLKEYESFVFYLIFNCLITIIKPIVRNCLCLSSKLPIEKIVEDDQEPLLSFVEWHDEAEMKIVNLLLHESMNIRHRAMKLSYLKSPSRDKLIKYGP